MPRRHTGGRRGNPDNLVPEFAQVAHALKGVDLPQDRQGLIGFARDNGAEDEVIEILEGLPDDEFHTMADVIAAISEAGGARTIH